MFNNMKMVGHSGSQNQHHSHHQQQNSLTPPAFSHPLHHTSSLGQPQLHSPAGTAAPPPPPNLNHLFNNPNMSAAMAALAAQHMANGHHAHPPHHQHPHPLLPPPAHVAAFGEHQQRMQQHQAELMMFKAAQAAAAAAAKNPFMANSAPAHSALLGVPPNFNLATSYGKSDDDTENEEDEDEECDRESESNDRGNQSIENYENDTENDEEHGGSKHKSARLNRSINNSSRGGSPSPSGRDRRAHSPTESHQYPHATAFKSILSQQQQNHSYSPVSKKQKTDKYPQASVSPQGISNQPSSLLAFSANDKPPFVAANKPVKKKCDISNIESLIGGSDSKDEEGEVEKAAPGKPPSFDLLQSLMAAGAGAPPGLLNPAANPNFLFYLYANMSANMNGPNSAPAGQQDYLASMFAAAAAANEAQKPALSAESLTKSEMVSPHGSKHTHRSQPYTIPHGAGIRSAKRRKSTDSVGGEEADAKEASQVVATDANNSGEDASGNEDEYDTVENSQNESFSAHNVTGTNNQTTSEDDEDEMVDMNEEEDEEKLLEEKMNRLEREISQEEENSNASSSDQLKTVIKK
jgi:hypothetical protein